MAGGRRRDFDALLDAWQVQEFVRVAETLAGVVDLKRVRNRNDALRVAGTRVSRFVKLMFQASDALSVEGLLFCYLAEIISRGSYRSSYVSTELFRGRSGAFEASILRIAKASCISEVASIWSKSVFEGILISKEFSQKSCVL